MPSQFDVTSLGSTMLRLSVFPGERLETAPAFQAKAGGTESNVMIALSRMGRRTAWVSRLTDNALGRRIAGEIGYHGVDTSRVVWTDQDRNEVYYVEAGARPRPTQVIYDRKHSAVSNIRFEDLDIGFLLNTQVLHLTGIFPALSKQCADVITRLIEAARRADVTVSFDVNYRAKLWSADEAARTVAPMMELSDIVIVTSEDAEHLFGITGTPEDVVRAVHGRFHSEVSVVTIGGEGGIACDGDRLYSSAGYPVDIQERVGAGDCFAAGVLCGYLKGSLQTGMNYAAAMAAIKLGIHGDYFVSDEAEVLRIINSRDEREVGR
jgi:2-dehydro-3-deoxygluconokinase